jgi:hypothetical protein
VAVLIRVLGSDAEIRACETGPVVQKRKFEESRRVRNEASGREQPKELQRLTNHKLTIRDKSTPGLSIAKEYAPLFVKDRQVACTNIVLYK